MIGNATWLTAAILLFGAVGVLLLRYAAVRPFKYRFTRRAQIACPVSKRPVECTFVGSTITGELVGLERCTAFADPTRVRCAKACLPLANGAVPVRFGARARGKA